MQPSEQATEPRGVSDDPLEEIEILTERNRQRPDVAIEKEIRDLRYAAFFARRGELLPTLSEPPQVDFDLSDGLPTVTDTVSGDVVRAAISQHGSLIVRGLFDRDRAAELREAVDAGLAARQEARHGRLTSPSPWFDETEWAAPDVRRSLGAKGMMEASGMMAADSPRGLYLLVEALKEKGIAEVACGVLGVRPAISVEKSLLRRVEPQPMPSWHQDGAFFGGAVRTLDVWVALSPCGKTAPGLEVFPHRVDRVLPTGCFFSWDLAYGVLAEAYPGVTPVSPVFQPGDAIFFDELCAHRTGAGPDMTEARYAIECWLFAPSAFPKRYSGLLI